MITQPGENEKEVVTDLCGKELANENYEKEVAGADGTQRDEGSALPEALDEEGHEQVLLQIEKEVFEKQPQGETPAGRRILGTSIKRLGIFASVFLCLAIGLGVGLGVGLGSKHKSSM